MKGKIMVLIILGCVILGTAAPVLAAGGSDGTSGNGGSSGNGGGSSASGSSSGNGGSSAGNSGGVSGSGSSSSSGNGDQTQTGPGTPGEVSGVPTQEQSRDRSQVTSEPSEVPTQEQSRDRSQVTSEPSEVPTQEQSRLQSSNQTALNDQYLQQVHDKQVQLVQDRQLSQDQVNRALALYSLTTAGNISGRNATQFVQLAEQVNQSYSVIDQARTRIQERSRITLFLFGGDAAAAQTLLQVTDQNRDRIQLMEQDLQNCDCNQTIRDQLQEQLMTLSQDQDRLRILANQTLEDRGIFGGFFR
jgi:hypothetical protein